MANKEKNIKSSAEAEDFPRQSPDVEEFGELAHERKEAMRNMLERAEREHHARRSEREVVARARELAEANHADETEKNTKERRSDRRHGPISKRQLNDSFKSQMRFAEGEMSRGERVFGRIIHFGPIEKTADILGATVARPNALLCGSIAAFVSITLLYFLSKYLGFRLSGFETLGAFILGWILGLLYDYASLARKKS